MKTSFLDFEQQIADLEGKIDALRAAQDAAAVDISDEVAQLEKKKEPAADEGNLFAADALADRPGCTSFPAALYARLPAVAVYGFRGTAWRSCLRR